jgi:starch-binding outer membrane protein, SusD/RagB family
MMKRLKYFGIILLVSATLSCSDDEYLTKTPLDAISDADFWKTPNDLKLYVNQFYTMLPGFPGWGGGYLWDDNNSDNMHAALYNARLAGLATITSENSNWNYSRLRSINIMLEQYQRVDAPKSQIDPIVGEAYFFRAYFYFNQVRNYGDVPWIDKPLTADSEELFGTRTARNVVVDNILSDLDKAISMLSPRATATGNRINKESAILFKSRVALYEGTWEKYHNGTAFGVQGSNGQKYLEQSAAAARQLIDLNSIQIYSTGKVTTDYQRLFNSTDLASVSEAILWRKYSATLSLSHNLQYYIPLAGGATGLTKSLVNNYLCLDGKPISTSPLYQGDQSLENIVANRDYRLRQTMWIKDDTLEIVGGVVKTTFIKPALDIGGEHRNTTGYQLKKGGDPASEGIRINHRSETAPIIFRYAEALLNFAEAKAELGTITQADIDLSINKLRTRVGMPGLKISEIENDANWDFPNLSHVINEVRRERRVELACEGYRLDDLLRWRAHGLIVGKRPKGAKFNQTQFPNMVIGQNILLDDNGYIDHLQTALPGGWGFKPERDYLLAVPPNEITLNSKLTQNPGW